MARVVVVGGGLSGCGAALAAKKAGAEVLLFERTDMLAGVATRAGETNGNGNFVGFQELRFMGGGELFDALRSIVLFDHLPLPDTSPHAFIFNTGLLEPLVTKIVLAAGIKVHLESRVVDVRKEGQRVSAIKLQDGSEVSADVFVDCTGTRGGVAVCNKYGKGCVMCLVRCLSFGDRIGIVDKAGGRVYDRLRADGTPGLLNSAMCMFKDTLAPWLKAKIEKEGLVKLPVPKELVDYSKVGLMGAARSKEFLEYIVLGDIGPVAKGFGMVYMEQAKLRQIPGFENVQVEDPRATTFNSLSHISIAVRDAHLKAEGLDNVFCAGEKGAMSAVSGAIISGYIAGHNAARSAFDMAPLDIPRSLVVGDFPAYIAEQRKTPEGQYKHFLLVRGEYWQRMLDTGLFTDDVERIRQRVEEAGMTGVLSRPLPAR